MSSKVHIYQVDSELYCDECDEEFSVEVDVDPETETAFWFCPGCESTLEADYDRFAGEDTDLAFDLWRDERCEAF